MGAQPEKCEEEKNRHPSKLRAKETIGTMENAKPLWHYNSQREQVLDRTIVECTFLSHVHVIVEQAPVNPRRACIRLDCRAARESGMLNLER
jgi:hypothetical protein